MFDTDLGQIRFLKLPPNEEWVKNGSLSKKVVGTTVYWQPRDLVLTERRLCFAKPGSDSLLDSIPLHEVSEVFMGDFEQRQHTGGQMLASKSFRKGSLSKGDEGDHMFAFTIATAEGGYNAGRSFTLSSHTEEERSDWVTKLQVCLSRYVLTVKPCERARC